MNINNWNLCYKRNPDKGYHHTMCETNLMYTPYESSDKKILCMHWDHASEYQRYKERPLFTEDLLEYFFNKEVENLEIFSKKDYTPEVYDIDFNKRKIFIEWSGETCNNIVYDETRDINQECLDWDKQIEHIVLDIVDNGYYKASLYPHCFFIKDSKIKTIDWYACYYKDNCQINYNQIKGMIGNNSNSRFTEVTTNGIIDFKEFFKKGVQQYIKWPHHNPLTNVYKNLTNGL